MIPDPTSDDLARDAEAEHAEMIEMDAKHLRGSMAGWIRRAVAAEATCVRLEKRLTAMQDNATAINLLMHQFITGNQFTDMIVITDDHDFTVKVFCHIFTLNLCTNLKLRRVFR